ncbi:MAG: tetratricopeptide repeat protein, partial [Burkholderiaceae bacterium]
MGLKINNDVYGEKHPRALVARSNFASVLMSQGRATEALPHFERALSHHTEVYGEKDPNTLTMLNNYAMALRDMGRYADA